MIVWLDTTLLPRGSMVSDQNSPSQMLIYTSSTEFRITMSGILRSDCLLASNCPWGSKLYPLPTADLSQRQCRRYVPTVASMPVSISMVTVVFQLRHHACAPMNHDGKKKEIIVYASDVHPLLDRIRYELVRLESFVGSDTDTSE